MEEKTRKISFVSIAVLCAAMLLAAYGLFGSDRSDAVLLEHTQTKEGLLVKVGVASSAGYIRTMRVKESNGDALVEFYSTFGINNPRGAKSEFLLEVSSECERVLFRRGKYVFRPVLQKDQNGIWIRTE